MTGVLCRVGFPVRGGPHARRCNLVRIHVWPLPLRLLRDVLQPVQQRRISHLVLAQLDLSCSHVRAELWVFGLDTYFDWQGDIFKFSTMVTP